MKRHILAGTVALTLAAVVATPTVLLAQSDTDVPRSAPTEFHGMIECSGVIDGGVPDISPEVTLNRGEIYQTTTTMSDGRLEGETVAFFNSDNYKAPGPLASIGRGAWRIDNAQGGWQGDYTVIGLPVDGSVATLPTTTVLHGDGAYEGLVAIWQADFDNRACSWDVRGLIVEDDLPPVPVIKTAD